MTIKQTGVGTRALNFVIDTLLFFILAFIVFKINNWYVVYWHHAYYNFGWFFFGSMFVYYTILEGFFARTPGKWFTQTKVVNQQNRKPSFVQILIRSLVRLTIIDMIFIGLLGKTLHDYISKTEVVEV
jgi:uncharacterized RDD family membrane protein YckC